MRPLSRWSKKVLTRARKREHAHWSRQLDRHDRWELGGLLIKLRRSLATRALVMVPDWAREEMGLEVRL